MGQEEAEQSSQEIQRRELENFYLKRIKETPPEELAKQLAAETLKSQQTLAEVIVEKKRLENEAPFDSLIPGFLKHKEFIKEVEAEAANARKMEDDSTSVLLMVDLDDFGITNETIGHPKADLVLLKIGEVILRNIRPGDTAGRVGGDELSVLMRRTTLRDSINASNRIRSAVFLEIKNDPRFSKLKDSQTMSVGITPIEPGYTGEQIRQIADVAVYEAKKAGRNQIAVGVMVDSEEGPIPQAIIINPIPPAISAHK